MWGYSGGLDISSFNFLCYASLAFDALETVKKLIPSKEGRNIFQRIWLKANFLKYGLACLAIILILNPWESVLLIGQRALKPGGICTQTQRPLLSPSDLFLQQLSRPLSLFVS